MTLLTKTFHFVMNNSYYILNIAEYVPEHKVRKQYSMPMPIVRGKARDEIPKPVLAKDPLYEKFPPYPVG